MRWTRRTHTGLRSVLLPLAWIGLSLPACSYDWTVPASGEGGSTAAGGAGGTLPTTGTSDGGQGGNGGTGSVGGFGGFGGAGGDGGGGAPTCAELSSCDDCRSCVIDGLAGTENDCWNYVFCVAPCGGDTVCLLACWAQHPAGYKVQDALIEHCTTACGGVPSCS